ncbi:MAG: MBL fold metallo-hydrolase [Burkholderiales bacterium]|nr:MBL fold metallo-hydrolase [Burkholderiales bacterium]
MTPPPTIEYGEGIFAVDTLYDHRAQQTAAYVIVERGRAAIVDTGTARAAPRLLAALAALGVDPEAVDWVVLTHVHLDHAGGAGQLIARLPNARLAVHPRGAPHMADPSRLVAAAAAIYGAAELQRVYGDILPVARDRIVEVADGATLRLAGRELRFYDAPGHARHHVVARDGRTGHLFAGDCFGLSYRELDVEGRQSVFPTTSPSQFDPEALSATLDRVLALAPEAVYVAHFGQLREVARLAADLKRLVAAHAALGRAHRRAGAERFRLLKEGVSALVLEERARQGWPLGERETLALFALDIELNAQGLAAWSDAEEKRRRICLGND